MTLDGILTGQFVDLRSVVPEDAAFILNLRQREEISKYMHSINITIEEQSAWIKKHRILDGDYYFLILDKMGNPVGTISLYDKDGNHCEIGRTASIGSAMENIEAIILTYDFAFEKLGYEYLVGSISPENVQVKEMNSKFGLIFDDEVVNVNGMPLQFGKAMKADYYAKRPRIMKLLEKAHDIGANQIS